MLMNNGQNTRSYSPVAMNTSTSSDSEEVKEKLKTLIKEQIEHEVICALTLSDLAGSYWKMGLEGHEHKMHHKSSKEFKENIDWKEYYHDVFEECPKIAVSYESKDSAKSIDDIYNQMYELHMKNKERLHEILKLVDEAHIYTDMHILLEAYRKCEEHEKHLESKMKRSQIFGYDVAHILSTDDKLKCEYEEHKWHKKKYMEEYHKMHK